MAEPSAIVEPTVSSNDVNDSKDAAEKESGESATTAGIARRQQLRNLLERQKQESLLVLEDAFEKAQMELESMLAQDSPPKSKSIDSPSGISATDNRIMVVPPAISPASSSGTEAVWMPSQSASSLLDEYHHGEESMKNESVLVEGEPSEASAASKSPEDPSRALLDDQDWKSSLARTILEQELQEMASLYFNKYQQDLEAMRRTFQTDLEAMEHKLDRKVRFEQDEEDRKLATAILEDRVATLEAYVQEQKETQYAQSRLFHRYKAKVGFGKASWQHFFGLVAEEPPLPPDLAALLDRPCPFWSKKRTRDTHLLVLIPSHVNRKPFTLELLGKLIQEPMNDGYQTQFYNFHSLVQAQYGTQPVSGAYWILVTRKVIPESRDLCLKEQKALVQDHAKRSKLNYRLPGVLEIATAIMTHHVRNGELLYPWGTWTRCQEYVCVPDSSRRPCIVGQFTENGIQFGCGEGEKCYEESGVAGCLEFRPT